MRCIGIIGAMEVEVASLKERMQNVEITHKASMEFYAGVLEGKKVVVVRSGIGKVNAAVCLYQKYRRTHIAFNCYDGAFSARKCAGEISGKNRGKIK